MEQDSGFRPKSFKSWRDFSGPRDDQNLLAVSFLLSLCAGVFLASSFFLLNTQPPANSQLSAGTGLAVAEPGESLTLKSGETGFVKGGIDKVDFHGGQNQVTFTTKKSKPQTDPTRVKSLIAGAYKILLSQVNKTVAQKVLLVEPDAAYWVLFAETANGGKNVEVIWEIDSYDFGSSFTEKRCNINIETGNCDSPCGGKYQTSCENGCFADEITAGVKDENTRDYGGVCTCGGLLQNACTAKADPEQAFECISSKHVRYSDGLCKFCGSLGQLPCDSSRGVERCPNLILSGGVCAYSTVPDNGGTIGGVGDDFCANPDPSLLDKYCKCPTGDGKVRIGCNPLELKPAFEEPLNDQANAYLENIACDNERLNKLGPAGSNAPYQDLEDFAKTETNCVWCDSFDAGGNCLQTRETPSDCTTYCPLPSEGVPLSDYLSGAQYAAEIPSQCESGVFEDGLCKQEIGKENLAGDLHPDWCIKDPDGNAGCINKATNKCGYNSDSTNAPNEESCCTGSYKQGNCYNSETSAFDGASCIEDTVNCDCKINEKTCT